MMPMLRSLSSMAFSRKLKVKSAKPGVRLWTFDFGLSPQKKQTGRELSSFRQLLVRFAKYLDDRGLRRVQDFGTPSRRESRDGAARLDSCLGHLGSLREITPRKRVNHYRSL